MFYISPPTSLAAAAADPLHTLFYVAFVLGACALFSITWIEVSGQSVSDVAQNLREQQYFLQVGARVLGRGEWRGGPLWAQHRRSQRAQVQAGSP